MRRTKIVPLLVFLTIFFFLAAQIKQYLTTIPTSRQATAVAQIVPGATWTAVRCVPISIDSCNGTNSVSTID
jgi:hypothetical protein